MVLKNCKPNFLLGDLQNKKKAFTNFSQFVLYLRISLCVVKLALLTPKKSEILNILPTEAEHRDIRLKRNCSGETETYGSSSNTTMKFSAHLPHALE